MLSEGVEIEVVLVRFLPPLRLDWLITKMMGS
jgi:hypothetical protein